MAKSIGGALSLVLTILILRLALPEVGQLVVEIIMKFLLIISKLLDHAAAMPIQ
jgi:hypothetical protein